MSMKEVFAIVAVLMTAVGYWYYIRDIFAHKTKPHAFSWLVWASLTAIAFAGQVSDGAGPGAWATLVSSLIAFFVFFLSFTKGEKNITVSDWLCLAGAGFALLLWYLTSNPLYSIILITIIDFLGYIPTLRKSFHKPQEETLIEYVLAGLKYVPAIIALEHYSPVTWLYPASLVVINLGFSALLIIRRRQLGLRPGVV